MGGGEERECARRGAQTSRARCARFALCYLAPDARRNALPTKLRRGCVHFRVRQRTGSLRDGHPTTMQTCRRPGRPAASFG